MELSRREALRRLTLLTGGALSAPALSAVLAGCRAEAPGASWTPRVLGPSGADLLTIIVDRIIPATDTPGASAAGVAQFIDTLLADWAEPEERDRFLAGLVSIDEAMREEEGVAFGAATPEQQDTLLARLDEEAARAREERSARARDEQMARSRAEELAPARDEGDGGEPAAREEPLPPFALLKEWTLVGYYTSEVGATQELRWLANPGRYAADMPLDEVGRAWA